MPSLARLHRLVRDRFAVRTKHSATRKSQERPDSENGDDGKADAAIAGERKAQAKWRTRGPRYRSSSGAALCGGSNDPPLAAAFTRKRKRPLAVTRLLRCVCLPDSAPLLQRLAERNCTRPTAGSG